jgi:alkylation response protein AidB-like acyl-CoA dehydrogenase
MSAASDAMDLDDPAEREIVATVRDFVDSDVRPVAQELEHANTYPEQLIETMKGLGIFGLAVPEPYGEVKVSTPCHALVTEELARGWMSLAGAMGGHTVVCKLLTAFGTDEQKQRYLPRLATGELRATMALTEPGGGSDLQAMRTTARRDGSGYVINGSKTWITMPAAQTWWHCCARPTRQQTHRIAGSAFCWSTKPMDSRDLTSRATFPSWATRASRAVS